MAVLSGGFDPGFVTLIQILNSMQTQDLKGLSILIVEDEPLLRRQLAAEVERLHGDVTAVASLDATKRALEAMDFDFLLLDIHLPDGLATQWLKDSKLSKNTGVIMMTAHGEVNGAVEAMRLGALDYLVKPFEPAQVALVLARARQQQQTARIDEHRRKDGEQAFQSFYFGRSLLWVNQQIQKILAADQRMQEHLPPVLIQGETGTGKTTIARWLHHHGPRAQAPLVEVNCSALPETLAESELFGHERGAFTDARAARMGLFEAANGGTLFLDELPSLAPPLQAKVLKALEDHRIRRLGGNREIQIDVRIIAAASNDLGKLVSSGQFRQDLYHRLDLYRLILLPLRERKEDLLPLADLLLEQIAKRHRVPIRPLSPLGKHRILQAAWPGNVRELAHELERATVFEEGPNLDLPLLATPNERTDSSAPSDTTASLAPSADWLNPGYQFPEQGFNLEEAINRFIQRALQQSGNNVSAASRLLGVSRDYVRYRLPSQKTD